jgi:hypothetical protein
MNRIKFYTTRLAIWWLERHGFFIIPRSFRGVLLGDCVAHGNAHALTVIRPECGEIVAINHSTVMLE